MQTVPLKDIIISPDRQRKEFEPEALMALTTSIGDQGLFHAPVLRTTPDGLMLVAGERRLRAIADLWGLGQALRYDGQLIPEGEVPYVNLGELDPLAAEEAELEENIARRDLTWQEHAAALQRLHNLRWKQATARGEKHSVAQTAEEFTGRRDGSYQDQVRKEIIVARYLDNPAIAKAKSADDAFKLLKREEERVKNVALAAKVGLTFSADLHQLFNVNCLEWMAKPEAQNRFDVILTDPLYGMGADTFGDGGGKLAGIEHHYDDSYENWQKLMAAWCPLTFAVTKPQAHAYVFCDFDRFHELKALMELAGWYVFRTPLIAHKINSGRVPLPDRGPRRQYELILYAIKGNKPVTHIYGDVISTQADENMSHGAQKPVALFQNLLQRSVRAGDEILDSFAGTGTIFPAGHTYQCRVTGLETVPEYFALGTRRLEEVKTADTLSFIEEA